MQAEELKMATQLTGPVMPIKNVSVNKSRSLCDIIETLTSWRGFSSRCSIGRVAVSRQFPSWIRQNQEEVKLVLVFCQDLFGSTEHTAKN